MNKKAKHLAMLNLMDTESNYTYSVSAPEEYKIGDRWFDPEPGFWSYKVYRNYKDTHIYPKSGDVVEWVCVTAKEFYKE